MTSRGRIAKGKKTEEKAKNGKGKGKVKGIGKCKDGKKGNWGTGAPECDPRQDDSKDAT